MSWYLVLFKLLANTIDYSVFLSLVTWNFPRVSVTLYFKNKYASVFLFKTNLNMGTPVVA